MFLFLRHLGLGGLDRCLELLELELLGLIRHLDIGVRVAAAAVGGTADHAAFLDVVEEGEELVELALADWIVFVVVAARTAQSQAQPGCARGVHAVNDVLQSPFLINDAALAIDAVVAVKAGGHDLIKAW